MSQIQEVRNTLSDHERRISRLERLVNPFAKEMEEGAKAKAVENLLDDESIEKEPITGDTGTPLPPQTPAAGSSFPKPPETNPPADVLPPVNATSDDLPPGKPIPSIAEQPSVNGNGEAKEEESKDETN